MNLKPIVNIPCTLEEFIAAFAGALNDSYEIVEGAAPRKLVVEWSHAAAADLQELMKDY